MRVHFILHEAFEAPGAYLAWAALRGHEVSFSKVYQEEPLPLSDKALDMLIVMGGPQSAEENKADFPYYRPQAEIKLIQDFIKADKPIVGVCLGAQLLGQAYGGQFQESPYKEIGNFPIELTRAGLADPKLAHFGQKMIVGHWHGDMPGLTEQAEILAFSEGCPRQIVKYSDKHYAFQCHLELTKDLARLLIASEEQLAEKAAKEDFVQDSQTILTYDYQEMNQALMTFLDQLTA